jgi:hypothetical protein
MSKTHTLLLCALLSSSLLLFWLWPSEQTASHRQQIATAKTVAPPQAPLKLSTPQPQATTNKTPVCQQVLPDQDWFATR